MSESNASAPNRLALVLAAGMLVLALVSGWLGYTRSQVRDELASARDEAVGQMSVADQQRRRSEEATRAETVARRRAEEERTKAEQKMGAAEQARDTALTRRDEARRQATHSDKLRREAESERQRAIAARDEAQTLTQVTERLRQQALDERRKVLEQMMRLSVAQGTRLQDMGDLPQALLWFADSLRLAQKEKFPEEAHRLRLAVALGRHPRLLHSWFPDRKLSALLFSPDGTRLASAGFEGKVMFHDVATGAEVGPALEHGAPVTLAVYAPDPRRMLTVSAAGHAHVWDLATGKEAFESMKHEGAVSLAAFRPDGQRVLTVSPHEMGGQEVQLWETMKGSKVGKPHVHPGGILSIAFLEDGRRLLMVGSDRVARYWDPETGVESGVTLAQPDGITLTSTSSDRRLLATAGETTARVWHTATAAPSTPPLKHPAAVLRLSFATDGRKLLTTSADGSMRVWDTATGELASGPLRPSEGVASAAFSPDGRFLVSTATNGQVRFWNVSTGQEVLSMLRHAGSVQLAIFAPSGTSLLTGETGALRLWDLTSSEPLVPPVAETSARQWFSPNGNLVARARGTDVQVYSVDRNQAVGAPMKHRNAIAQLSWTADSLRLLTVSNQPRPDGEGEVFVWDAMTGVPLAGPMEHIRPVIEASFSGDGQRIVTACRDFKARVWDSKTGRTIGPQIEHQQALTRAIFSPDGKYVATVAADDLVRVFDAAKGEKAGEGVRYDAPITLVQFTADSQRFLTGGQEGTARVWECPSGKAVTPPLEHKGPITGAVFSADGKRVVTLCGNNTARVWDIGTGKALTRPLSHPSVPTGAALSSDGRWLATAVGDGVRLWDVATSDPLGPPLIPAPGRPVVGLSYGGDGKLITSVGTVGDPRGRQTWDVTSDTRPTADLTLLIQALTGSRLDESGNTLPWSGDEAKKAWATLKTRYPDEFAASAARRLAWHRRGVDECEKGQNWVGMVRHLDPLLAASADSWELYSRRARARTALGDRDRALADLGRATELKPERADLWVARAALYGELGRWDRALADYNKAIEREGNRLEFWTSRGRAAAELGDWDRAMNDFSRAITLGREDAVGFQELALTRLANGDIEGYRQTCGRMIKRIGVSGAAGPIVGWTCVLAPDGLTDYKTLLQQAERTLAAGPRTMGQQTLVAALLLRSGQAQAAVDALTKIQTNRSAEESPRDWLFLALAHRQLGRQEEARSWGEKAQRWLAATDRPFTWQERLELGLLQREGQE